MTMCRWQPTSRPRCPRCAIRSRPVHRAASPPWCRPSNASRARRRPSSIQAASLSSANRPPRHWDVGRFDEGWEVVLTRPDLTGRPSDVSDRPSNGTGVGDNPASLDSRAGKEAEEMQSRKNGHRPGAPRASVAMSVAAALMVVGGGTAMGQSSVDQVSQAEIDAAMTTPTTLTFWTWVPNIEKEVALFEAAYPAIDVEVVNVGQG